jgi:O-antigen/teichoic acid export membrane protein
VRSPPLLRSRPGGLTRTGTGGRRAAWSVLDQILSSVTNFALAIVVAQIGDKYELGAFEVVFSVYLFASGCSRALGAEPLLVRHSDTDPDDLESAAASAVGISLVAGLVAAVPCLAVAAVIGDGPLALPLVALGVTLPALLVQDAWRYVFFAAGRPAKALVNDLVWGVVLVALIVWLLVGPDPSVALLVLAWGGSATVAALLGMWQTGILPRPSATRPWLHRQRDLVPRFLGEFVVGQGAAQLSIWLVGIFGGLGVLGALRAAGVLVGPARLFLTAAPGAAIPELIRIRRRSPARFQRLVAVMSWGLALSVGVWMAAVLAVPDRYGEALLKANWEPGRRIFLLIGLSWAALGLGTGAMVALRVLADAKGSFRARMLICPVVLAVPPISVAVGDEMGAAAGIAVVSLWSAGVWWAIYRRSLRTAEEPQPADGPFDATVDALD